MKLHLGCGNCLLPDFINIDLLDLEYIPTGIIYKKLDVLTIDKVFPTDSVELIQSAYLLEHFTPIDVVNLIFKCSIILKPGGLFIARVPNFKCIVDWIDNENNYNKPFNLTLASTYLLSSSEYTVHKSVWTPSLVKVYFQTENVLELIAVDQGFDYLGHAMKIIARKPNGL